MEIDGDRWIETRAALATDDPSGSSQYVETKPDMAGQHGARAKRLIG